MTSATPKFLLLAGTVLAYWLVCFAPYNWLAPASYTLNDAQLSADNLALSFAGAGLAQIDTGEPHWQHSPQSLRLTAELTCSREQQFGPARIVTLSENALERHFMLGQDGAALVLRWLRPNSNPNGVPQFRVEDFFAPCRTRAIELLAQDGRLRLRAGDQLLLDVAAPLASMERWVSSYPLHLGNEGSWDRGWAGTLSSFGLEVNGSVIIAGFERVELPHGAWLLSQRALGTHRFALVPFRNEHPDAWKDNLLNIAGFLPFGGLLALLWPRRLNVVYAGLLAACLSLSIEFGQVGFEGRYPSATDLVTNTMGGIVGYLLVRFRARFISY